MNYSVGEIRKYASDALITIAEDSPAAAAIKAIRTAGRKYQTYKNASYPNVAALDAGMGRGAGWLTGLGQFRAIVGVHVATLATMFDIDVEEDLASIFPLADLE